MKELVVRVRNIVRENSQTGETQYELSEDRYPGTWEHYDFYPEVEVEALPDKSLVIKHRETGNYEVWHTIALYQPGTWVSYRWVRDPE